MYSKFASAAKMHGTDENCRDEPVADFRPSSATSLDSCAINSNLMKTQSSCSDRTWCFSVLVVSGGFFVEGSRLRKPGGGKSAGSSSLSDVVSPREVFVAMRASSSTAHVDAKPTGS